MSPKSFHPRLIFFQTVFPEFIVSRYGTYTADTIIIPSYFIEVIVKYPSFFVSNSREVTPLIFRPIEPPVPPPENRQTIVGMPVSGKWGTLGALLKQRPMNNGTINLEAKLPNPAIIICKAPIPLSFVLKRALGSVGNVRIESIQITLRIITSTKFYGTPIDVKSSLNILGKKKLTITLPAGEEELYINPADLTPNRRGIYLPSTLAPSFRTCNIARKYSLVVEMKVKADKAKSSELIQVTVDVQVYPGSTLPRTGNARVSSHAVARRGENSSQHLVNEEPPMYEC